MCFKKISKMFQKWFNQVLFYDFVVAWISSQLPEQKEDLFYLWLVCAEIFYWFYQFNDHFRYFALLPELPHPPLVSILSFLAHTLHPDVILEHSHICSWSYININIDNMICYHWNHNLSCIFDIILYTRQLCNKSFFCSDRRGLLVSTM